VRIFLNIVFFLFVCVQVLRWRFVCVGDDEHVLAKRH